MPVLPAVPSTMVPPGRSAPEAFAVRTIDRAARSLIDWPGLRNSALPRISQPVSSDRRLRRISGVLPIRSMMERVTDTARPFGAPVGGATRQPSRWGLGTVLSTLAIPAPFPL